MNTSTACDEMWHDPEGFVCDVWADGIHLCVESGDHDDHVCACKATTAYESQFEDAFGGAE